MDRDSIDGKTRAVLDTAASRLGVPVQDARLLRLHGNASYALPSAGLVIRIATNPGMLGPVTASIAVTRWLASRGFPCTVPADIDDQPFVIAGYVVSAWQYVPTADTLAPTSAEMGDILRELHAQGDLPYPLASLDDPFASVAAVISEAPDAMSLASRSWLQERITWLRRQWSALDFVRPVGLIHGTRTSATSCALPPAKPSWATGTTSPPGRASGTWPRSTTWTAGSAGQARTASTPSPQHTGGTSAPGPDWKL